VLNERLLLPQQGRTGQIRSVALWHDQIAVSGQRATRALSGNNRRTQVAVILSQYHDLQMAQAANNRSVPPLTIPADEVALLRGIFENRRGDRDRTSGADDMPLAEYFRLLHRMAIESRDEACHLSMRPLTLGTTDFVFDTLVGAHDLEEVMRRVARAYNLIHGGAFNRVELRRDRLVYVIDDRAFPYAFDLASGAAHAFIEGVLIFLHALLSIAAGADLSPSLRVVRSRRPARSSRDGLLAFWTAPTRCNAPDYALEYDRGMATRPVRPDFDDSMGLTDVYGAIDEMIAAREGSRPKADFAARAAEAIASGATGQPQVARRLGVSVATLRRRLGDASLTFRDVRARVLNDSARSLLQDHCPASTVAETLGFADGRSFARAFKAWNGVTPAAFAAALPAQEFALRR